MPRRRAWPAERAATRAASRLVPRTPTSRPPGEHLAVLARIVRQIDASEAMTVKRRRSIKNHLMKAMQELQRELGRK